MTSTVTPQLLNVDQAAEAMSVSTKTVRRLIATGEVPHVRVGRAVRIRTRDLDRYIEAATVVGTAGWPSL